MQLFFIYFYFVCEFNCSYSQQIETIDVVQKHCLNEINAAANIV